MSILQNITINSQYTRSINLERDHESGSTIASYIPTSRSKRLLKRITESLNEQVQPRAWSLIGPYGSGKSSFSVFLSHLLSDPLNSSTKIAFSVLEENQIGELGDFKKHTSDTSGYLKVLISGSPESLSTRIIIALHQSVRAFWNARKGKKPAFIERLETATAEGCSSSDVIKLFKQVQDEIAKINGIKPKGILLVVDELGKFLEYEARHYGANDVFLLQELAELACKGHTCNLLMFVLLHQSFEQYAKGLGETLKNEWAKVQGRFEEVPFLESSEQTLKVVSKAIVNNYSDSEFFDTIDAITDIVNALSSEQALPSVLNEFDAQILFKECYPLHPLSALILPHLCQKLAQNERTLFNFLGSTEEHGFVHSLESLSLGCFITPDVIFDYFITNQSSVVSDHLTHRRWAEVVTAVERLGSVKESVVKTLKTIGLFNIINAKGNFKASEALLSTIGSKPNEVKLAIAELTKKSIITYRAYNNEYRVWQGSDFDLEDALQEQLSLLGNFSLSEELNSSKILKPLVARKYTVENGTLRYFISLFSDAKSYKADIKNKSNVPRIIFFLAYGQDDVKLFEDTIHKAFGDNDIVVLCRNSTQLKEAFAEVIALRKVEQESQALKEDPVAKREYFDRRNASEATTLKLIKSYELEPQNYEWFFLREQQKIYNRRDLQSTLSSALSVIYKKAPSFHNELINRDIPSSQANAGRNKLLAAMIDKASMPVLSIERFPPEKSMYLSILKKHQLHIEVGQEWRFVAPNKNTSLWFTWQAINKFLESTTDGNAKTFQELDSTLSVAPYGIKKGILPILYVHALLVHKHEVALFEDGVFIPTLTIEAVERFIKAPHCFKVESFKIEGLTADIFDSYKLVFTRKDGKEPTLLDIAKPLSKLIGSLEEFTKKSSKELLGDKEYDLLKAFSRTKSPHKLLLETLPSALGFEKQDLNAETSEYRERFSNTLITTLKNLKNNYPAMIDEEIKLFCRVFNEGNFITLELLRKKLYHLSGLEKYSFDIDGLKAFIMRLSTEKDADELWFENVLTFLAGKPPQKWLDTDRSRAQNNLSKYAARIAELEVIRIEHGEAVKHIEGDFDVILLKSLKKGVKPREKAVTINQSQRDSLVVFRSKIEKVVKDLDDDLKSALYAELVDDFLSKINDEN
ncbi:hypothetical protein WNY63_02095 [Pseudoalteromonas neustonica]|uniref:ATP-binding protein n=1 Tax=Pseudoalteromonas neustonica TaxID=1840331 RepID=A0ABU9TXL9_9GAMM